MLFTAESFLVLDIKELMCTKALANSVGLQSVFVGMFAVMLIRLVIIDDSLCLLIWSHNFFNGFTFESWEFCNVEFLLLQSF